MIPKVINMNLSDKRSYEKFFEDKTKHLNKLLIRQIFDMSSPTHPRIKTSKIIHYLLILNVEYDIDATDLIRAYITQ